MTPLHALVGFAGWTLLLIACVFLYRGLRFLQGTPINHWPRGAKPDDDAPAIRRLEDAHANCLESLPIFAVIVLAAATVCAYRADAGPSVGYWQDAGAGARQLLVCADRALFLDAVPAAGVAASAVTQLLQCWGNNCRDAGLRGGHLGRGLAD